MFPLVSGGKATTGALDSCGTNTGPHATQLRLLAQLVSLEGTEESKGRGGPDEHEIQKSMRSTRILNWNLNFETTGSGSYLVGFAFFYLPFAI